MMATKKFDTLRTKIDADPRRRARVDAEKSKARRDQPRGEAIIDGHSRGQGLTEALEAVQEELGVKPTGTVDPATVAAFERAIASAGQSSPTPAATPSL